MINKFTIALCGLCVLPFAATNIAQQEESSPSEQRYSNHSANANILPQDEVKNRLSTITTNSQAGHFSSWRLSNEQRTLDKQVNEAAKALRQSKTDSERTYAREELTTLLSDDYDARLAGYDENLKQLEQKLNEMRDRLQKRREAKADMIQLRIKVLVAESNDLGWPERMSKSRFPSGLRKGIAFPSANIE